MGDESFTFDPDSIASTSDAASKAAVEADAASKAAVSGSSAASDAGSKATVALSKASDASSAAAKAVTAIQGVAKFSITIEDPSDAENICIGFTFVAITVIEIQAVVKGSDTPSVTIDPSHSTNRSGEGNDILTNPLVVTNTTTGQNDTDFDDDTIPADSWIFLLTTAKSGTVDELTVTIKYTVD